MQIKVNTEIKDYKGNSILITEGSTDVVVAKTLIVNALTAEVKDSKDTGLDKFKKYKLAMSFEQAEDVVDITIEEAKLIKDAVGLVYSVLFVGRIYELLGEK